MSSFPELIWIRSSPQNRTFGITGTGFLRTGCFKHVATGHYRCLAGTSWYCLVSEACVCVCVNWLLQQALDGHCTTHMHTAHHRVAMLKYHFWCVMHMQCLCIVQYAVVQCPPVRHLLVLYQNGRTDRLSAQTLSSAYPTLFSLGISKKKSASIWKLAANCS